MANKDSELSLFEDHARQAEIRESVPWPRVKAIHYYFYLPGQEAPHVVTKAQGFQEALAFARNAHPQAQYLQRLVVMEDTPSSLNQEEGPPPHGRGTVSQ